MVRDLLGHRTMGMTGRYVAKHVDPLRAAADAVSGQIAAALDGPPAELCQSGGVADGRALRGRARLYEAETNPGGCSDLDGMRAVLDAVAGSSKVQRRLVDLKRGRLPRT